MVKEIIILTKSRKYGGYCIAGIDRLSGEWIRMVANTDCIRDELRDNHIRYEDGKFADIFDVVQVELLDHTPNYFQPENYLINASKRWKKIDKINKWDIKKYYSIVNKQCNKGEFIFYNDLHKDNFHYKLIASVIEV